MTEIISVLAGILKTSVVTIYKTIDSRHYIRQYISKVFLLVQGVPKKSPINWTGEGKSTSSQDALPEINLEEAKQEKRRIYKNLSVIAPAFLLETRCFPPPLSS